MTLIEEFKALLGEIDGMIDQYESGGHDPSATLGDVFSARAAQRPLLERAERLASRGLERFPLHGELLRRRAWLRARIVTPKGDYPELEAAEEDLRLLLATSPDDVSGAFQLVEALYTFSGMEDGDIARVASDLGDRAERLLIAYRALQIHALLDADDPVSAREVLESGERSFPGSQVMMEARARFDDDAV